MTTKLNLYNKALRMIGERRLGKLSEERSPRRYLDSVWDQGGVDYCLEQGQWHFAMRAVLLNYDPAIEPSFGYSRAFQKPSDWVLTSAVCSDEFFSNPLTAYFDEAGYWYSDQDEIYVRYVSNDTSYGKDYNKWPVTFEDYVAAYFAAEISLSVHNDMQKYGDMLTIVKQKLLHAKSRSAMADGTKFFPQGSWTKSRNGGSSERGNRNSLYG